MAKRKTMGEDPLDEVISQSRKKGNNSPVAFEENERDSTADRKRNKEGRGAQMATQNYESENPVLRETAREQGNGQIGLLKAEVFRLIDSMKRGKLSERASYAGLSGDYLEILEDINQMLYAVIDPFSLVSEYVDRISRGDIPDKITDEYRGDYNEIKNNINNLLDSMNNLSDEAAAMAEAAAQGQLDRRVDVSNFQGIWAKVVQGFNNTAEGMIVPMRDIGAVLDRMAAGDLKVRVTADYKGDYDVLKVACNELGEQLQGVQEVLDELQKAAADGKLDARGDAGRFKGDIAGMIAGLNNVLDAVIGPLNVAAEYVDRISKGDIPDKITDKYRGDYNEIKNNINNLLDSMNNLSDEAAAMAEAAAQGQLDRRVDVSNFQGIWAKVVQGFNNTAEGMIVPMRDIGAVLDRMAAGDLKVRVTADYKGDYDVLKVACNELGEQLQGVQEVLDELQKAAADGKLDARGDAGRFKGDIAGMIAGLNNVLDAVVEPINEATDVLKMMAASEFSARVKGEYKGDHAIIKDSLNTAAEAVQEVIRDVSNIADKLAVGDLSIVVEESKYRGDIVSLAKNLKTSVENLRNTISRVSNSAQNVASAAEEISAATEQIGKGTQNQASAADETGSTMEEMAAQIQNVAKNAEILATNVDETSTSIQQMGTTSESVAKNAENMASNVNETSSAIEQMITTIEKTTKNVEQADKLSQQSSEEAKNGGEMVLKTVEGMKNIGEMMKNISGVIQNLGSRSEAIGSIVETIEEIADQTNLLALNAAIEAARAGDAGRGFAVVADEVRKLAERSMKATKEIGEVIKEVQKGTGNAVKATEEGDKNTREGIAMADQAGEGIKRIMDVAKATSNIMQEISQATAEQSIVAKNVVTAVEEMNKLTQEVTQSTKEQASGVQQIVKAAETMAQMTDQVKNATIEQKRGGENVVKAVENINEIAKSNLGAVEQLTRSAKDLSQQSEGMVELVREFKLEEGTG